MVMISDNRIERNARTHDFLLILLQKVERIPADISKHQTCCRTGEGLCCLAEVFHRLACKLCELLLVPGLRISYRHDGIISRTVGLLQIENKLLASGCLLIEGRHS